MLSLFYMPQNMTWCKKIVMKQKLFHKTTLKKFLYIGKGTQKLNICNETVVKDIITM